MKPYENKYSLTKNGSYDSKYSSENKFIFNFKFAHKIFNTIILSLLILISILSFLSINSQREWSKTYKVLSKTKAKNNNLIDYISKTEEFYIKEFESLNNFKKTTPSDLIYIEKVIEKKENFLNKIIINIIKGIKDSNYHLGY